MPSITDLLTPADAIELRWKFAAVVRKASQEEKPVRKLPDYDDWTRVERSYEGYGMGC